MTHDEQERQEENSGREAAPGDQAREERASTGSGVEIEQQGQTVGTQANIGHMRGNIYFGEKQRDKQYEIALNWDGRTRMREFDLSGRNLSGLNLAGADLTGARLRGTDLNESDLSGAILNGADLHRANLWRADLSEAQLLDRPNLFHADLREATLYRAKIFAGNLHGANLRGADLRQAEVAADMSRADLSDAKLQGADLSGAGKLWQSALLAGARYDKNTAWPGDFDPRAAGAILVEGERSSCEETSEKEVTAGTYLDEKSGLEMIHIPAGEFLCGEDKRPEYLPEFWISKTPVTNGHYLRFVRATERMPPRHWKGMSPRAGLLDHPVTYVSWHDAKDYADWAGMDLPSDNEWEKGARGTDGRMYPWGSAWREGNCNTQEAGMGTTTPVGQYSPQGDSPYGCVDMAGNVWEWTASRYMRGGSWVYLEGHARAAFCSYGAAHECYDSVGFRVVRRLPAQ